MVSGHCLKDFVCVFFCRRFCRVAMTTSCVSLRAWIATAWTRKGFLRCCGFFCGMMDLPLMLMLMLRVTDGPPQLRRRNTGCDSLRRSRGQIGVSIRRIHTQGRSSSLRWLFAKSQRCTGICKHPLYRLPATESQSPGIPCRQWAINDFLAPKLNPNRDPNCNHNPELSSSSEKEEYWSPIVINWHNHVCNPQSCATCQPIIAHYLHWQANAGSWYATICKLGIWCRKFGRNCMHCFWISKVLRYGLKCVASIACWMKIETNLFSSILCNSCHVLFQVIPPDKTVLL